MAKKARYTSKSVLVPIDLLNETLEKIKVYKAQKRAERDLEIAQLKLETLKNK